MKLAEDIGNHNTMEDRWISQVLERETLRLCKSHNVLGSTRVANIELQLLFEYTIGSRSTDVMMMALPAQNINHSAFRSMFEREKLSGINFNDWFCSLNLVLRVEKKLFVIKQPIPPVLTVDSTDQTFAEWNAIYDAHNEVACLMLGKIGVGLILNGLTSDFVGFVRNYNMQNMGKTIGELHALLIEYEKRLPKKTATPQVLAIQGGRIQKSNKKSQNDKGKGNKKGKGKDKLVYAPKPKKPKPSAKEHLAKDDACHHCKEGFRGEMKLKQGVAIYDCHYAPTITRVSKNNVLYFNTIPRDDIYEIDMLNLMPNVNSINNVSNKRVKHNLDSYLRHCRLAHISKKRIEKLQHDGLLKSTDDESFDQCVSCLSGKMTRKPFPHRTERATDLIGLIHTAVYGPLRDMCEDKVLATL
ncbi:retrotransposon protein, putative, ty1-copia subclass [Tanacetum coccineum]